MKRHILRILFILATLVALFGLWFMINGSFETCPTEEQIEKARIAGAMLLLPAMCVDGIILGICIRKNMGL